MRSLLPLALLALAIVPAEARDLFVDNLAGYTIEPRVLDAPNCQGPAFNNAKLAAFERGLCVFHRAARSPADTEQVIDLLNEAQVAGLPPVHQQLAGLVSGLAHCSEAERHMETIRSTGESEPEVLAFCSSRRAAQAEFGAIRWNNALFEYADGLGLERSLSARLTEMSACHAGVLAPSFDAQCSLISNLSESEIGAIVDQATEATIRTYFSGVESPITAMFSRKLERSKGLVESAEGSIVNLEEKAAAVNSEYDALNSVYVDARDHKMGPIYDNYRNSILRATAILDEYERWKGGLFVAADGNLMPKIEERSGEIAEELARIAELKFADKATSLVTDIKRIVNGEAEDRKTIAALCRVYFCELTDRRAIAEVIRTCRRPALAQYPLCIGDNGQITNGKLTVDFEGTVSSVDIVDLCRGAGVEEAFTAVNLAPATTAACLANLQW
jgi:hypothetical protein